MTTKSRFIAALFLSTALISASCLSGTAYAHDHEGQDHSAWAAECNRASFSDDQKKLIRETMHRLHHAHKQAFEAMHKLHESMHGVLSAETFDQKAFMSLAAQIGAKRAELEKERVRAFASIAGQFTPEQRKFLARIFLHHPGMQGKGRHGHEGWRHHGEWMHHEEHGGWSHQSGMTGSDATIGQYQPDPDYPPYAPR